MPIVPKFFVEYIEKAGVRRYFKDSRFNPVTKTSAMTSPVGVDSSTGQLYSVPYSLSDMTPFKIVMTDTAGGPVIDKSFSEIKTAYTNGRKVFLDVGDDLLEIQPSAETTPTFFNFSAISLIKPSVDSPTSIIGKFAIIRSDNSVSYSSRFMSESSVKPDKVIVYEADSQAFLSGFATTDYYGELQEAVNSNIKVRCEVLCGASKFYLDLKRHLYDAQHENENMFVFSAEMFNSDLGVGWWMQLEVLANNTAYVYEGEFDAHEV